VYYPQVLEAQTGLDAETVEAALQGLERKPTPKEPWILREGRIIWIRNGLKHDPTVTTNNEGQWRPFVVSLPRSQTHRS
jgi:hypothetical protein